MWEICQASAEKCRRKEEHTIVKLELVRSEIGPVLSKYRLRRNLRKSAHLLYLATRTVLFTAKNLRIHYKK